MEWRCEWCGAPQEEDDPPCENCGHGSFERAVVPAKDINDGEQEAAIVWECTECGRDHPKNVPPCSRCGNPTLEQTRLELDDEELASPGYLDLITPRYAVAAVAALLLAAVVFYGLFGVSSIPGIGSDAPGDPDELDGMALAPAEQAYLDEVNERRETAGAQRLERTDELDEAATAFNQQGVAHVYEDQDPAEPPQQLFDVCEYEPGIADFWIPNTQIDDDVAAVLLNYSVQQDGNLTTYEADRVGLDTHASPDDHLFVTVFLC